MSQISIIDLAHYFHLSLDEIPQDLRKAIQEDTTLINWDSLSLAERVIEVQSNEKQQEDNFSEKLAFAFVDIESWLKEQTQQAEDNGLEGRRLALIDVDNKLGDYKIFKMAEKHVANKKPSSGTDLSTLFDPVTKEQLEKMFPCGKWSNWVTNASRNGLKDARVKRSKFNPYKAGEWFVSQGIEGWDMARVMRTLGNNLPSRSIDSKHYFE